MKLPFTTVQGERGWRGWLDAAIAFILILLSIAIVYGDAIILADLGF